MSGESRASARVFMTLCRHKGLQSCWGHPLTDAVSYSNGSTGSRQDHEIRSCWSSYRVVRSISRRLRGVSRWLVLWRRLSRCLRRSGLRGILRRTAGGSAGRRRWWRLLLGARVLRTETEAAIGMTVRAGAGRRPAAGMVTSSRAIVVRAAAAASGRERTPERTAAAGRRRTSSASRSASHRRAARRCLRLSAVNHRGRIAPRRHPQMAATARAEIHAASSDATADKAKGALIDTGHGRLPWPFFYPRCECCALYNSLKVRPTGAGMSRVPVHPLPNGKREIAFLLPPMRSSTRTASFVKSAYATGRFAR